MKMESPRAAFLDRNFMPFLRTASDPSRVAAQMVRDNMTATRSLSTSPKDKILTGDRSPQLQKLTRMDSYRVLPKQKLEVTRSNEGDRKKNNLTVPQGKPPIRKLGERRTTSNLGIERIKRKKEDRRQRSQSSPMFPPELDATDPQLGTSTDTLSNESLETGNNNSNGAANSSNKRTPVLSRKKSLMSLKDFNLKKLLETKPKLKRSQSQKIFEKPEKVKVKHPATDDDDSDHDTGGPLFQATTLFVPGYDFKNKKSSTLPANLGTRKSSTPHLSRRSSKDRMSVLLDKVITRQNSTPCLLFKRDSKEKMKKIELQIEEKIIESPTSITPPPSIISNEQVDEDILNTPAQSNDDPVPQGFVDQRKASIALKQKQFREKGHSKSFDNAVSISPRNSATVKEIAGTFEDGSVYVKVKNLVNKTSDLSLRHNSCDYDTSPRDGRNSGMESGYVSPDNLSPEMDTFPADNLSPETDTFSNSWSHSNWTENDEKMINKLCIPTREYHMDLCFTEL